jgi:methionine-rich copper-binding protein CopC
MSVGKTLSVPFLVLSLATAPFCLAGQAFAHAQLKTAIPAANSTAASPEQLILKFSEGLEIKFTSAKVIGPDGKAAPTGARSLDPNDKTSLIVPVKRPLTAGKYEVEWHAVAVDTHKTQGSYSFTVRP